MKTRRIASLFLSCALAFTLLPGCTTEETADSGGTAPTPVVIDLSGAWDGGGVYYTRDDGSSLNMAYDLTLNLAHATGTGALSGNYSITRPVLGTRTGPLTGTAANGQITLTMPCCWSIVGTYDETTISFELTETFSSGQYAWIKATGTVTRQ